jgi:hypothetical protein
MSEARSAVLDVAVSAVLLGVIAGLLFVLGGGVTLPYFAIAFVGVACGRLLIAALVVVLARHDVKRQERGV